jgi:hypothetical protein
VIVSLDIPEELSFTHALARFNDLARIWEATDEGRFRGLHESLTQARSDASDAVFLTPTPDLPTALAKLTFWHKEHGDAPDMDLDYAPWQGKPESAATCPHDMDLAEYTLRLIARDLFTLMQAH